MRIRNKNVPSIVYISLLALLVPITIFSTYLHFAGYGTDVYRDKNVNKEFKYDGKLYFYEDGILIGTYTCKSENCDYASNYDDDVNYDLKYHKYENKKVDKIINNRYAFIVDDGDLVILYDILEGINIATYGGVKNYGIGIENDNYIVKLEYNSWGVIDLSKEIPELIIPFSYSYIGLLDLVIDNKIVADNYVVFDGVYWKIVNNKHVNITTTFSNNIVNYDSNLVVTKSNNLYSIYDYRGNKYLPNDYLYIDIVDKYLILVDSTNNLVVYNTSDNIYSSNYIINDINSIETKFNDEKIEIYFDGNLQITI